MTSIEEEIVADFNLFDDPMDKYEHIIDLGKEMPVFDEKLKVEANLVKGCQSKVWLNTTLEDGKVFFRADSNTVITKGIIALLIKVLSGNPAEVVVNHPLDFIKSSDLREHLSSQRSNGLTAMIMKMKSDASKFI